MLRKIIMSGLAISLLITAPVFARGGQDDNTVVEPEETTSQSDDNANPVKQEDGSDDQTMERMHDRRGERRDLVEERKSELEAKHRDMLERRVAKLEGKRLEICEKREAKINALLEKGVVAGHEHHARIQSVANAVEKFYEKRQLSVNGYDAALELVHQKEAEAVAALEVVNDLKFDCASVDSSNPSTDIKSLMENKRTALKAYRDSVKELILLVKHALNEEAKQ